MTGVSYYAYLIVQITGCLRFGKQPVVVSKAL